ncbi:hypothetical protein ACJIZ3_021103 [Penstemon smallii]|uniref:J domain-containing protein n=1 Tax=Penstemon smallii TaxID=265156 RepID=A0ABD3SKM1_9LAMI
MAAAEDKSSNDFYAVLGLKRDCTTPELRNAYKKLAMKWHPDRYSASGNSKYVEEAKKKFQAIQQAYSVLADADKRFLYDVGVYDCDDHDDQNGMGDFLNEMATMMTQNKSNNNESFEQLQELFDEMFHSDIDAFSSSSSSSSSSFSCSRSVTPPSQASCSGTYNNISNKRNSFGMNSVESTQFEGFCIGAGGTASAKHQIGEGSRKKNTTTRKCRR